MSKQPDQEAFLGMIEENKRILLKVCNSYCANKSDREDLAQEIIYQLWKAYPTYNQLYKYSTWMYRIALNVAISFYRKGKTASGTITLTDYFIEVVEQEDSLNELEENSRLLHQFMQGFKELDRALLILYLDNKNYKEIADILGITETNVATKIGRLKDKLKQKFATAKT